MDLDLTTAPNWATYLVAVAVYEAARDANGGRSQQAADAAGLADVELNVVLTELGVDDYQA